MIMTAAVWVAILILVGLLYLNVSLLGVLELLNFRSSTKQAAHKCRLHI